MVHGYSLSAGRPAGDLLRRTAHVADHLLAAGAPLLRQEYAGRTRRRVFVAGVRGLPVSAGWRRTVARVAAVDASTAGDGGLENRAAAVAHHLLKRASEARGARASVIPPLASVIAARQRFTAHEVALVPPGLVDDGVEVRRRALLPFALRGRERRQGTAGAVALVLAACAQGGARTVAEDLAELSPRAALVFGAGHVSGGGAAAAGTHDHDRAWWARPGVAL
jgi:hypothetical protein